MENITIDGKWSLEEMARLADAFTVIHCEKIGKHQLDSIASTAPDTTELMTTGIANVAYVALFHSDETVRRACRGWLEKRYHCVYPVTAHGGGGGEEEKEKKAHTKGD